MKIPKLFPITLLVISAFPMLILFGCSGSINPYTKNFNANEFVEGFNQNSQDYKEINNIGKGTINDLEFSPNGKQLAVARSEGLWLFDTGGETEPIVLLGHEGEVFVLAWVDNKTLASGGADTTIRLWNVKTGKLLNTLRSHEGGVNTLIYSSKAKMLASGSSFRMNYFSKLPDKPVKLPSKEPIKLPSDPDELREYLDKLNREWDDRLKDVEKKQKDLIRGFTGIDESGKFDNTIRLWKVSTGELQHTLEGKDSAAAFAFTADGKKLRASGNSEDGPLVEWNLKTVTGVKSHLPIIRISEDASSVFGPGNFLRIGSSVFTNTVFSRDGTKLARAKAIQVIRSDDRGLSITYESIKVFVNSHNIGGKLEAIVTAMAFSLRGDILAIGSEDMKLHLWNAVTGKYLPTLEGHTEKITALAFSRNGTLASGSQGGTVLIWK